MKTLLCFALLVYSFILNGQTLDESYADSGVLINNNPSIFGAFALQSNGKLIVAGPQGKTSQNMNEFVLNRYNTQGKLDSSFGKNGVTAGDKESQVIDLAIQQDDAIIAAAQFNNPSIYAIRLKRFKKNGGVDTSFGKKGSVMFSINKNTNTYEGDMIIQPDGKILMCGYIITPNQTKIGFLARFLSNGSIDRSFSNVGYTTWFNLVPGNSMGVTSLVLQKNGQILVCWYSGSSTLIYRYFTNGFRDDGFGLTGTAQFYYSNHVVCRFQPTKLVVQPDDKVVGTGLATDQSGNKYFFTAGRLTAAGIADFSYGSDGLQPVSFDQKVSTVSGNVLQNDGKLIIAGTVKGSGASYAMARLTANGLIDSAFGDNGTVVTKFEKYSECQNILLQSNGKILLSGNKGISTTNILIARYDNTSTNKNISNIKPATQSDKLIIMLSPNPAKNLLKIEGLPSNQKIKISVIDFAGNKYISRQLMVNSNSPYNLNVASLKPGNYLLNVDANNSITSNAFIKE